MTLLGQHLAVFLREHLPRDRGASPHTCEALRSAIVFASPMGIDRACVNGRSGPPKAKTCKRQLSGWSALKAPVLRQIKRVNDP